MKKNRYRDKKIFISEIRKEYVVAITIKNLSFIVLLTF